MHKVENCAYVCVWIQTCNRILAAAAFFGHSAFVAVHTVDLFLMGGEAGASQRLSAGGAHKALWMPRLVLVIHTSCGNGLEERAKTCGNNTVKQLLTVIIIIKCLYFIKEHVLYLQNIKKIYNFKSNHKKIHEFLFTFLQQAHCLANFFSWQGLQ